MDEIYDFIFVLLAGRGFALLQISFDWLPSSLAAAVPRCESENIKSGGKGVWKLGDTLGLQLIIHREAG